MRLKGGSRKEIKLQASPVPKEVCHWPIVLGCFPSTTPKQQGCPATASSPNFTLLHPSPLKQHNNTSGSGTQNHPQTFAVYTLDVSAFIVEYHDVLRATSTMLSSFLGGEYPKT
jgi:hypothetical protein